MDRSIIKNLGTAIALVLGVATMTSSPGLAQEKMGRTKDSHWLTSCQGGAREGPFTCIASEIVFIRETSQKLVELALVVGPAPAEPRLRISGPFGFNVANGFKLAVDNEDLADAAISHCDQKGCYVSIELEPKQIGQMKAGRTL